MAATATTGVQPAPTRARRALGTALTYALLVLMAVVFVFPLLFMLSASFKSNAAIFADLRSLRAFLPVGDLTLDNYAAVFTRSLFPRFLFNSLLIATITVALNLLFNSMAAYALSRLAWAGKTVVLSIIIATLVIPGDTVVIPLLLLVSKLPGLSFEGGLHLTQGWLNTYHVQIVPFLASAFSIFLFYQFFQDIPRELDEAATIDGAGRWRIYRSIIVPISGPVFATVAILTFLSSWNSFLWPIMTVQSEQIRPVLVGMQYFFQQDTEWGEVMAYATLITLPILAFFLAFQRSFVRSIATAGLKG
ncbi:MAG TPA: carbohydrate ABC transporter permease [Chloroflexaceae bacterium]|nr:carbohydrate ABC transporter permease [Chloroflexaceae bacterium]